MPLDVLELLEPLLLDELRSPNRFVLPRIAPRLTAPVPIVAFNAALAAVFVPLLPALLDESELELEPDESEPEDSAAVEELDDPELVDLEEDEDEETVAEPPPDEPPPPPDEPRPLRLPRICGTMSAANRSAVMVPLSRTVRRRSPVSTTALGRLDISPVPPPVPV